MYSLRMHATTFSGPPQRRSAPLSMQTRLCGSGASRMGTRGLDTSTIRGRGIGEDVVGTWLDLSSLVSSGGAARQGAFPDLANNIGTDVYVDINGWHLYLKDISATPDMKMHELLADQLAPDLLSKGFDERRIEAFLKQVPLMIGGGKLRISLRDAIPSFSMGDLMKIFKRFAEEKN